MRVFKYLDHDEITRSRICMFKDVNLSNMLFRSFILRLLDEWTKNIKNT